MLLRSFAPLFILALILLNSCSSEAVRNKALEAKMQGEWRSKSLRLTMNTFSNKDTTRIFEVDESNWEARMNIHPIKTIYFGDGTYVSEHTNLRDSIVYAPAGRWTIIGDSIVMRDTFPQVALPYSYKVKFIKNTVVFEGMEDCDNDGSADDKYYGVLEKQNRSAK